MRSVSGVGGVNLLKIVYHPNSDKIGTLEQQNVANTFSSNLLAVFLYLNPSPVNCIAKSNANNLPQFSNNQTPLSHNFQRFKKLFLDG